ncbi:hypothetical protein [Chitinolyticbacter albus]|uniref:hypothetical protein n=1 Tax=Chitinolyticbacter albus TaxID=2961951 RepID=UPI00210C72FD|nr:hypothetical protein [Chitinolyticbacter albus]
MNRYAVVLFAALLAGGACAEDVATAEAVASKPRPVIHRGEIGQTPVEVAFRYLKDHVADERGIASYQQLAIQQQAKGDDFQHVKLDVEMKGLKDDAMASQRFKFTLSFEGKAWVVDSVSQDWKCRRGGKGWTQKPCK